MKHLIINGDPWCDTDDFYDNIDDPREATCSNCLKIAAAYGAAAAMRYAAVEAGATRDPELVRERDAALEQVNRINRAIARQGGFYCFGCQRILARSELKIVANDVAWCTECAPHGRVTS